MYVAREVETVGHWHGGELHSGFLPKHGPDIKGGLMKAILQQAGLSEEEFRKLL